MCVLIVCLIWSSCCITVIPTGNCGPFPGSWSGKYLSCSPETTVSRCNVLCIFPSWIGVQVESPTSFLPPFFLLFLPPFFLPPSFLPLSIHSFLLSLFFLFLPPFSPPLLPLLFLLYSFVLLSCFSLIFTSACSFPLAVYTREFITSVVIGNDIIPRRVIYTHICWKGDCEDFLSVHPAGCHLDHCTTWKGR